MQPRRKTRYHVPNRRKSATEESLRPIKEWFDKYKGPCLFVTDRDGSLCGQDATRRHTIPNARVLSKLVDKDSNVLELQWGVSNLMHLFLESSPKRTVDLFDPATFEPITVGRRDASVGKFACGDHDPMFDDIDYAEPDIESPIVRFLLNYRVLLYITDLLKQGSLLITDPEKHSRAMRDSSVKTRVDWLNSRERIRSELLRARSRAIQLGKTWLAKDEDGAGIDPNLVSGRLVYFRSKLKFAASLLYGEDLTITVAPLDNDQHRMAITHLTEISDYVASDIRQLVETVECSQENPSYGVAAIDGLARRSSGRVAVSPESYQELDREDQLRVNEIVQFASSSTSLADTIESGRRFRRRWQKRGCRRGAARRR